MGSDEIVGFLGLILFSILAFLIGYISYTFGKKAGQREQMLLEQTRRLAELQRKEKGEKEEKEFLPRSENQQADIYSINSLPSSVDKGNAFEEFVAERFVVNACFTIKDWHSFKGNGMYVEANTYPDLLMELKRNDGAYQFAVECKWRKDFQSGSILEWATSEQFLHYITFAHTKRIPVFVVIGVGGEPGAPNEVYVLPLQELTATVVKRYTLQPYRRRNASSPFYYDVHTQNLE